jgi:hypothetical protein
MARRVLVWSVSFLFAISSWSLAQNPEKLTARELFYKASQKPATQTGGRAPAPATLGLRYSLLKGNENGQYEEVDIDTVFRRGDGIRLTLESNQDAYLYLVNRGSSGTWKVIFPCSQIENGNNHVPAHRRYDVPADAQFTFEDPAGEEHLFVVLSQKPEPDLEDSRTGAATRTNNADCSKDLSVQTINDDVIGKLRNSVLTRDLVFEKVDDQTSARKEKAAYVVNAPANLTGRVVGDLRLKHR